jgi:uncharacterized protein (TIGR02391 family)
MEAETIEPSASEPQSEPEGEPENESEDESIFWWLADFELRRELDRLSPTDFAGHVRTAFIVLERRIRQTAGLAEHDFGTDLIDKAFAPDSGVLQPVSPAKAECAGLHNLLKGIFLYYRNPVAHRPIDYNSYSARRVLTLIDHALHLVNEAADAAFDIDNFVGPQEGTILHRHDFRLDIDGDGDKEIVAVIGFGPVTGPEGLRQHVAAVILKKTGDVYKRIPAESIPVPVVHEVGIVEVRNVTSREKPDLVMYWFKDDISGFMAILKEVDGKYVIAKREIVEEKEKAFEASNDYSFAIEFYRFRIRLADVDGDGLVEISHTIQAQPEQLTDLGYPGFMSMEGEVYDICRVMKWNEAKGAIEQIDEKIVVGLWRPETG